VRDEVDEPHFFGLFHAELFVVAGRFWFDATSIMSLSSFCEEKEVVVLVGKLRIVSRP
jgi:hypothetical protein